MFEVAYYDVADRKITENINVTPLKSMMETEEGFVKASVYDKSEYCERCFKIDFCRNIGKMKF